MAIYALGTGRAFAAAPEAVAACTAAESDFNGDGLRDTAIADPDATVGGKALAGTVTVVYGGDAGVVQLHQDLAEVPGEAEAEARFGKALAHADLNGDGCADLVVGAPYKDVGTARDSGAVYVVHGAPGGLGTGPASLAYDQTGVMASEGPEAGDLFGYALTGGTTSTSQPFLVIGAPGEDVGSVMDAGNVHYLSGKPLANVVVTQASTGVWDNPEAGDRFGAALASTDRHFAVGAPGEAIGTEIFSGAVLVFSPSLNTSGVPDPVFGFAQSATAGSDTSAEAYDRFGTSLAMVATRAGTETTPLGAQLAVGIPGEDIGSITDAGAVGLYRVNPDKTLVTVEALVHQDLAGVEGDAAAGDFFGQQVALVNTAPTAVASGSTVKFAVGVPGKESAAGAEHLDKGGVQIFPAQADVGTSDEWIDPGWGIPGVPEHQMFAGSSLAGTPQALLVGVVNPAGSTPGAVYAFDWSVAGGGAPARTFVPGEGGIPAGGTAFGSVIR
ncbi:integrin alpha [Streptomyces sp. NBC_01433]|uniref:integrin alpha n=1 Tax=Streptomyces sp. NBC_01433 TaxID=2903864 RepID=UPI00224F5C18|nr:integrin alpha [Streptomyces sp. NBC_01433]MCX4676451.1 integrin alpha [Streptomyces sp. NBC_01433]